MRNHPGFLGPDLSIHDACQNESVRVIGKVIQKSISVGVSSERNWLEGAGNQGLPTLCQPLYDLLLRRDGQPGY
jgi:hypothetical protein